MAKNEIASTEAAAAPKTLQEKLADAQARVAKLQGQINSQAILEAVAAGDTATFRFGRGEKSRELAGTINAVGDITAENGRVTRMANVLVGEGLDAETYKVRVADILTLNGEGFAGAGASDEDDTDEAPEAEAPASEAVDPFAT